MPAASHPFSFLQRRGKPTSEKNRRPTHVPQRSLAGREASNGPSTAPLDFQAKGLNGGERDFNSVESVPGGDTGRRNVMLGHVRRVTLLGHAVRCHRAP